MNTNGQLEPNEEMVSLTIMDSVAATRQPVVILSPFVFVSLLLIPALMLAAIVKADSLACRLRTWWRSVSGLEMSHP